MTLTLNRAEAPTVCRRKLTLSSRLAVKRTSLLLSAVTATLATAALVAGPAAGGGGGGAGAGGGGHGGGSVAGGSSHASAGGSGYSAQGSMRAAQQVLHAGSRVPGSRETRTEGANVVRHLSVEGKPAVAVRLNLARPLKPDDLRRLRWRGFTRSSETLGSDNSPLFCSHSLYHGERQCVWFLPAPST